MLCSEFAIYINNCYKKPSRLFTAGGKEISDKEPSKETQNQPMGIDVLGLIPLLTSTISNNTENLIHIVFADDY